MNKKINDLKKRLQESKTLKGCIRYYPDELKQEALVLQEESGMSIKKFAEETKICSRTIKSWIDYFGKTKTKTKDITIHEILEPDRKISLAKNIKPRKESQIQLSYAETKESKLLKKRIRNKKASEKLKVELKKSKTQLIEKKTKKTKEVSEDIKIYLEKSINKAIPIVRTRGDVLPKELRDMQEEWLKNNTPKTICQ